MEPQIIQIPALKVVGLGAQFVSILSPNKSNMSVIPQLWDQFVKRQDEIKNRIPGPSYGLVEMLPPGATKSDPDELYYIACTGVTDFSDIPRGMINRSIPEGKYAKFTHKGMLNTLGETASFIYKQWVPNSKTKLRGGPHIEVYDQRFNPHSNESEFDICLPLQ